MMTSGPSRIALFLFSPSTGNDSRASLPGESDMLLYLALLLLDIQINMNSRALTLALDRPLQAKASEARPFGNSMCLLNLLDLVNMANSLLSHPVFSDVPS